MGEGRWRACWGVCVLLAACGDDPAITVAEAGLADAGSDAALAPPSDTADGEARVDGRDGASPDVTPAAGCACRVCENGCMGPKAGCGEREFCALAAKPPKCLPLCDVSAPKCRPGTTCGMTMDCDVPIYVCR